MQKSIEQYSTQGTLICLFFSIQEASEQLNIPYQKLYNLLQTGAKYKGNRYKYYGKPFGKDTRQRRRIERYDAETGEVVDYYDTITEAAEALNICRNRISKCIKENVRDSQGYKWRTNFI